MRQVQLPLWDRVVFVDWHGVLSRDPFWVSILEHPAHPLRTALRAKLGGVFGPGGSLGSWMLGVRSAAEVITAMDVKLDRRFRSDFLLRRLESDCGRMQVNVELIEVLQWVRTSAFVVIATDNVDAFVRAFDAARVHRRRSTTDDIAGDTFGRAIYAWDDLVCSSEVRTLKSDDPAAFFGPWLEAHRLRFDDALLIDDREDNCSAFAGQGGEAVRWKFGEDEIATLQRAIGGWIGRPMPGGW